MSEKSLGDLAQELIDACAVRDWERLKLLDEQINTLVERNVAELESEIEKTQLMDFLKQIQKIYQLVIADSSKHRDEISSELRKLMRDKKAAASYSNSAKLK